LSPARRSSAVSACTRSPVVSFYGSPQPERTFGSPAGRRAFGAGCSGGSRHTHTSARARVNPLRRRSHIGPRGLARHVLVNDGLGAESSYCGLN
jgi:hypothetical protein